MEKENSMFAHARIFLQNYVKRVDESEKYAIIFVSAKKYPNSCILHNFTTGGRLGVILCQM